VNLLWNRPDGDQVELALVRGEGPCRQLAALAGGRSLAEVVCRHQDHIPAVPVQVHAAHRTNLFFPYFIQFFKSIFKLFFTLFLNFL
jgi:hypothetical protein